MAERRAHTITNQIDNNFEHMEKARVFIEEEEIASQEQLRETLGKIKSLLSLNRFALVDEDNVVYTQYTTYTEAAAANEFLSREKMGDRIVSAVTQYGSSRQLCCGHSDARAYHQGQALQGLLCPDRHGGHCEPAGV